MRRLIVTILFCAVVGGCQNPAVDIAEIMSHSQCKTLRTGGTWVDMPRLARIRGAQLLDAPADPPATSQSESTAPSAELLLAISNGTQPSAGYGFQYDRAAIEARTLKLRLNWQAPSPDQAVAQVLTSPCVVYALPPPDLFDRVEIFIDGEFFRELDKPAAD